MSRKATASAFANWVYEYHHPKRESPQAAANRAERLKLGKATHGYIEIFLGQAWTLKYLGEERRSGWRLWFADVHDVPEKIFEAPTLTVGGETLKCVPDLVLYHEELNEFLVVERKTTRVPFDKIPENGWPNLQSQLWCYSWIAEFAGAARVHLVGQMWSRSMGCLNLSPSHPSWERGVWKHESDCRRLFEKYGGKCLG